MRKLTPKFSEYHSNKRVVFQKEWKSLQKSEFYLFIYLFIYLFEELTEWQLETKELSLCELHPKGDFNSFWKNLSLYGVI